MMMLTAFFQSMPGGLWVHLLKPDAIPTKNDQWNDPLIVRVKDNGSGWDPKLLVNCREIARSDLDRTLKRELAPRREWVVYVDGDDAVAFQHVATVIDSARSRGAKVVLFHDPQQPDLEGFKN
jgi:biopolymer transport protein ExbD